MIGTILIVAAVFGYTAWVIVRKIKESRKRWKEGCGGCCGCCGSCKGSCKGGK